MINRVPNSVIQSHVKEETKEVKKTKTKEEIEEEKKLKREKMKQKMGNSTKKILAQQEEKKKKEMESASNHHDSEKIKSMANILAGKIGIDPLKKSIGIKVTPMDQKLNKLYGCGVEQEKEIVIEDDDCNDNSNKNVTRRITVTKLSQDIEEPKEKREDFILEESKPRTLTHVKKFKKKDFKLDK